MAGITLLESAKMGGLTQQAAAVTKLYAESTDILRAIPFMTINGGGYTYSRENTLPGVAFRGINGSWTASAGVLNPQTEHLAISGGEVDVDRALVSWQGPGVRAAHVAMKVKHLAHYWTYKFIKGDNTSTASEFDGLQNRLTGNQLIAQGSTSGGDVLTLAKLDQLIDSVLDPTHLIMSRAVKRLLTAATRSSSVAGDIRFEKDDAGYPMMYYGSLPILVADNLDDYYSTLAFDEANPGGGSSVGTSIYCVSFRPGMLQGIHNGPPDVQDLGEIDSSPVYRTRIEWNSGVLLEHPKAAARLYGIKTGSVTA